jgi:transposase
VQEAAGEGVEPAYADQGHTGEGPAAAARARGTEPEAVGPPGARRGFVPLLPRRRAAERTFARTTRFRRRLARDHERLPLTLAGLAALVCIALRQAADYAAIHNGL